MNTVDKGFFFFTVRTNFKSLTMVKYHLQPLKVYLFVLSCKSFLILTFGVIFQNFYWSIDTEIKSFLETISYTIQFTFIYYFYYYLLNFTFLRHDVSTLSDIVFFYDATANISRKSGPYPVRKTNLFLF